MSTQITWHGHSAFQITCSTCSIIIDPFFTGNPSSVGGWQEIAKPDVVLVTHAHGDHIGDAVEICKGTGAKLGAVVGTAEPLMQAGIPQEQILNGIGFNIGGTLEVAQNVFVTLTEAFHTTDTGACTGFIITLPDKTCIYHAGDTGVFSNMSVWGELYDIDIALLPIGGVFTMDARQAALAAKLLQAKSVIPMHWGTFPVLAQSPDAFTVELEKTIPNCTCVVMQPGETRKF